MTTTVFVSFGDNNLTRQTSCFFTFYLLGRTYRTNLQQKMKISTAFSKTSIHPFQCLSYNFAKCFWVSVGNILFSIMFQFLQDSWVIRINSFFVKYHQREVLLNTSCSHMHSFWATGLSSGPATRLTSARFWQGGWESLLHGGGLASDLMFVLKNVIVFVLRFNWYTLYFEPWGCREGGGGMVPYVST
jgi:hypothetical protein